MNFISFIASNIVCLGSKKMNFISFIASNIVCLGSKKIILYIIFFEYFL